MSKATGVLVYQVPNRGRANIEGGGYFADFRASGHVLVASGWQADIAPGPGIETMVTPVARNHDGSSITGPAMARVLRRAGWGHDAADHPRPGHRHRHAREPRHHEGDADAPAVGRGRAGADRRRAPGRLPTARRRRSPARPIPPSSASRTGSTRRRSTSSPTPRRIRRCTASALPPRAISIAFLRRHDADHPLGATTRHAIAQGTSQSGNYLRSFLHLGFNQDERAAPCVRRHEPEHRRPAAGDEHPLRGAERRGRHVRARQRRRAVVGRLHRRRARPPRGRLAVALPRHRHVPEDRRDVRLRRVLLAAHVSPTWSAPAPTRTSRCRPTCAATTRRARGTAADPVASRTRCPPDACCVLATNPNPSADTNRALMKALVAWVVKDTPPPRSRYPTLGKGDLVPPGHASTGFPVDPRPRRCPTACSCRSTTTTSVPGFRVPRRLRRVALQPPVVRQIAAAARAEGGRRRQRDGRRAQRAARGAARHLHGLEPARARVLQGADPGARRRLHSVCEDQGAAARVGRPAPVARGALRHARGLRGAR